MPRKHTEWFNTLEDDLQLSESEEEVEQNEVSGDLVLNSQDPPDIPNVTLETTLSEATEHILELGEGSSI